MLTRNLDAYLAKLLPCPNCSTIFHPGKSSKQYCSSSCGTSFSNRQRKPRSDESKQRTSATLKATRALNSKMELPKKQSVPWSKAYISGPYSKLYICSCGHCGDQFSSRTPVKYCSNHSNLYKSNNRNKYAFTFNVYHYPGLFNLDQLNLVGWYSPGGKSKSWNPDGLSRDHKVSVNEAIRFGYDPYYIKHPLNCDLITQQQNNCKKTRSSIAYSDLVQLVDAYDLALLRGLDSNQ